MEVDMSDKAITARLKRVEDLRRLCLSLGKATIIGKVKPKEDQTPASPSKQENPDEHRNR
jgi:hypothetical protein